MIALHSQTPGFQGDQANNLNQADRFRHGRYDVDGSSTPNRLHGKVAYNVLYCDGHASTLATIEELWDGVRRRRTP